MGAPMNAAARRLQIFRSQSSSLRDAGEHSWADFFVIVKREDEVGPVHPRHRAMRVLVWRVCLANGSCSSKSDTQKAGTLFSVIEAVGDDTQRESLNL